MDKNKIARKKYNEDKTYVQITKKVHLLMKEYCKDNNITVKDFLELAITSKIKSVL